MATGSPRAVENRYFGSVRNSTESTAASCGRGCRRPGEDRAATRRPGPDVVRRLVGAVPVDARQLLPRAEPEVQHPESQRSGGWPDLDRGHARQAAGQMYLRGAERRWFDRSVTVPRRQLPVDAEVPQQAGRRLARAGRYPSSPVDQDVGPPLRQHPLEPLGPKASTSLPEPGVERCVVLACHDEVTGHEVEGEAVDAAALTSASWTSRSLTA